MANLTMNYTSTLAIEECCKCHIVFAMPKDLQRRCREKGETFYCPLGHGQVYSRTELQELKDKLAREEQDRRNAETSARAYRDQADAAERSASAYKGHLTRARKRIGNGTCPAPGCGRHFTNVERHMASQHPGYADTDQ